MRVAKVTNKNHGAKVYPKGTPNTITYRVNPMRLSEVVRKVNRAADVMKEADRDLEDAQEKVRGCHNFLISAIKFHKEAKEELNQVVQDGKL